MTTGVVIATYNGSRYIKEQLQSIVNQSVLPSEIIISDDGSSDGTVEIIESFIEQNADIDTNFVFVRNSGIEHGVRANFQNAVDFSSAEYIFFCDQDDVWCKNKIERSVSVLRSHRENVLIHDTQILKESEDGSFHLLEKRVMAKYPFDEDGVYKLDGTKLIWQAFYHCLVQGMSICIKRDY